VAGRVAPRPRVPDRSRAACRSLALFVRQYEYPIRPWTFSGRTWKQAFVLCKDIRPSKRGRLCVRLGGRRLRELLQQGGVPARSHSQRRIDPEMCPSLRSGQRNRSPQLARPSPLARRSRSPRCAPLLGARVPEGRVRAVVRTGTGGAGSGAEGRRRSRRNDRRKELRRRTEGVVEIRLTLR
jgi:hypothetical protein